MDSRHRSGGYGSDVLFLATEYAFNNLQLSIIGLTVFPSNTRSIRAYEKIGFKIVDVLEKTWAMPDGEQEDLLLMEIIKDDNMAPANISE